MSEVSRRNMLKGAALAGAGLAASGAFTRGGIDDAGATPPRFRLARRGGLFGLGDLGERRVELERQFQLNDGTQSDGTTWSYRLADPSAGNIRALVQQEQVADTDHAEWSRLRWEEPSAPGTFRLEDVPVHTLQLLDIIPVILFLSQ